MEEKLIKRQKQKRFLSFLIIFIILSITVVISLKSDYFKIKEVEVKNNNLISRDEAIILANVIGENIFFLDKNKVKTNILNNPYVKDVKINKKLPSKILLTIEEKDIKGIIRVKNYFVDIDSEGRMVHTINKFPNGKLIYLEGIDAKEYVFNEYVTSDSVKLKSIVEILKIFSYIDIKSQIEKVDVKDPYNVNIITKSGINICVGDCSNLEYKLSFAMTLLKSPELSGKKGTIDISSDGTAVFNEKR
ncbi:MULTISPECIES: cell division protein FtsQ/DivIB [Caloramator]|uniref:POTRA domain-containing protein, FtsQ-type n=1 Tax=Caloramator proteoclasticus DSM 10124 TaxID=1121262 RepID=A0A1M4UE78_9CLOT|nr:MULTISPECIES: FtsQ-type POTRA domain-containing protein [Caloramator]SHE54880.1 POTRA domain-containing protein, FtsQ-type [Caloramator proteoclasticus DSM 10124]